MEELQLCLGNQLTCLVEFLEDSQCLVEDVDAGILTPQLLQGR